MATDVIMPMLGLAQDTGRIVRWLKAEGDPVVRGEPLMEVETDKVTVEIEAPADGTLAAITGSEGDDVPVGHTVALVLAPGEALTTPPAALAHAAVDHVVELVGVQHAGAATNGAPEPAPRRVLASPKARRLASEHGVTIERIAGSGPHGAIVADDVIAVVSLEPASKPVAAQPSPTTEMSSAWRVMAKRTTQAWQEAPHFFLQRECAARGLNAWRDTLRTREGYETITHTDLLVKLCAATLEAHPQVNSSWRGDTIVPSAEVNVGIAVATARALVVPVIARANTLALRELSERRAAIVQRARDGALRGEDVSGGTFTISNLGMFGVDAFQAILNAPQAAILAVGRITDRVVAVDGRAVVSPMVTLTLSFDHRVVDGAAGARFVDHLAGLVEEPVTLIP